MAPTCSTSREKATSAWRSQQPYVCDVRQHGVVDSTMRLGRLAAMQGVPSGHCVAAQAQRAGRGRSGAPWVSAAGTGLYVTIVLWPAPEPPVTGLSAAMSLAVLRTCRAMGVAHAQVKWPNDVVGRHGKIAGLLLEQGQHADGERFVLLGIGLNVRTPTLGAAVAATPHALPPSGLRAEGGALATPADALGPLLGHIEAAFARWQQHGLANEMAAFDACHAYLNEEVHAFGAGAHGEDLRGRVGPIAADGSLALVSPTRTHQLISGHLRPVAQAWGPSP